MRQQGSSQGITFDPAGPLLGIANANPDRSRRCSVSASGPIPMVCGEPRSGSTDIQGVFSPKHAALTMLGGRDILRERGVGG